MEEKFIIRVDEEYPSDHKIAVQLVEAFENQEYKQRIDELLKKIDKLLPAADTSVLREIKEILSDLNSAIKSLNVSSENKIFGVTKNVNDAKDMIADLAVSIRALESKVSPSGRLDTGVEESLQRNQDMLSDLASEIKSMGLSNESKFYDINDNIQDIKDKINKRGDAETREMILALSDKLDANSAVMSEKLDAMQTPSDAIMALSDKLDVSDMRGTVRDLAIHVDNLARKYDDLTRIAQERQADADIMDRHIVSELDVLKNSMSTGISEQKIKTLNAAINRVNRTQQKVDSNVKVFNAYLQRLNSVDYMLRLLAAKNLLKTRKRMPKWAREKKKVLDRLMLGLEDEVADILIVNAIPSTGMTMTDLSKAIGRSRRKTQERIAALMAAGFVEERTIKRKKIYFLVS